MRKTLSTPIGNVEQVKENLLAWGASFDYFMLLDSNSQAEYDLLPQSYLNYQLLAAVGHSRSKVIQQNVFRSLKAFVDEQSDWFFLHLTFDVKTETHGIGSHHPDPMGFPAAFIFEPLWLVIVQNNDLQLHYPSYISEQQAQQILEQLLKQGSSRFKGSAVSGSTLSMQKLPFNAYQEVFGAIQYHLHRGDIYEMNYCINFSARDIILDPYATYLRLTKFSPAPFSAFYKHKDMFLLSASPERFLKKTGLHVISQPIKGTVSRGKTPEEDIRLKDTLRNSEKERSENIMITDLVRNDMSQFAQPASVRVSDLCGVYSFRHVHQMISTIECKFNQDFHCVDAIRLAFPMGSMTGAPKRNALKFIEEYETFNRGLFSGSVGYISPNGDFDLNVVIRSILYNASSRYLSIPAGSAITVYANARNEYDECQLKAQALIDVLS